MELELSTAITIFGFSNTDSLFFISGFNSKKSNIKARRNLQINKKGKSHDGDRNTLFFWFLK